MENTEDTPKIIMYRIINKTLSMTADNCLESLRKQKLEIYLKLKEQIKHVEIPQGKVLAVKIKTSNGLLYDAWTKGD